MKICLITAYLPPLKGGISSNVFNLSRYLKESPDVTCVKTITQQGKPSDSVTVIKRSKYLFSILAFLKLLKIRPDVINSHSAAYTLIPAVIYKFLFPASCLVHSFHTDNVSYLGKTKKNFFRLLLSSCDHVTFVSNFLSHKIEEFIDTPGDKRVIPPYVSSRKVDEGDLKKFINKFSLKESKPVIAFIGVLEWEKKAGGVKKLILALKIILEKYPSTKLLIIGDGRYRKDLEDFVREEGLKKNVFFTGLMENVFIPLKASDIYAHISLQDAMPTSILEAMITKKPVVATKIGGIPELIAHDETGILVEPEKSAIARAIIGVYENKEKRRELTVKAYNAVIKIYNPDRITKEFLEVYRK